MHNPLRSEAEMFRFVVIVGAGCALVIAVTLLTNATAGVILLAALVGLGVGLAWRGSRGSERQKTAVARGDAAAHRLLVVANQTVGGRALLDEIKNRSRGRASEILVTVPALPGSKLDYWASATDQAVDQARQRLDDSIAAIEAVGLADELIISTHPRQKSKWLERGVVERAREDVDLPITHVVVDLDAEAAPVG
jgi:hypothetical protein